MQYITDRVLKSPIVPALEKSLKAVLIYQRHSPTCFFLSSMHKPMNFSFNYFLSFSLFLRLVVCLFRFLAGFFCLAVFFTDVPVKELEELVYQPRVNKYVNPFPFSNIEPLLK